MIVATADVHYTKTRRKKFKREKEKLKDAIAFVVAGDITVKGGIAEAYWFAEIFRDINIPKLYVLGNHDYWLYNFYEGRSRYTDFYGHLRDIDRAMKVNGFHNLSNSPVIVGDIAFCGVCGWYDGSLEELVKLSEEDRKLKQRIISNDIFHLPANITPEKLIKRDLENLKAQLEEVSDVPYKVCVMHFSPVVETLTGCSKAEYVYLGTRKFFDITQKFDLVIHGHAHEGNKSPVKVGNTWYLNVSFELHKGFVRIPSDIAKKDLHFRVNIDN